MKRGLLDMGGVGGVGGLLKSGDCLFFLVKERRMQMRPASGINNPPIPPIPPTPTFCTLLTVYQ